MIVATLSFTVPKKRETEVIKSLQSIAGPVEAQPNCMRSHFFQDVAEEETFGLLQEWKTEEDLTNFLRSREYRTVLELIELASVAPEMRFFEVRQMRGLDLVEEARLGKSSGI